MDDLESVSACRALTVVGAYSDALAKATKFVQIGGVSDVGEARMFAQLTIFKLLASFFVKDRHGPFG